MLIIFNENGLFGLYIAVYSMVESFIIVNIASDEAPELLMNITITPVSEQFGFI